jgi:Leucine-rich repeat (LRR) protein
VKVTSEKRRAESALRDLRKTAPAFYSQAEDLIKDHKFDHALQKISYAIALVPNESEYHYFQGNILESLLRIEEARDAYARAIRLNPDNPLATANLKLCENILKDNAGKNDLSPSSLYDLETAFLQEGRLAEAAALVQRMKADKQLLSAIGIAVLGKLRLKPEEIGTNRLQVDDSGMLQLDLSNTPVEDLSPLRGLPLASLNLSYTRITDLSPLEGMQLRELRAGYTRVHDLTPLQGMPLRVLNVSPGPQAAARVTVTDLSSLKGMPLVEFGVAYTRVTNLDPLRGMPLESLILCDTPVHDLGPLKGMGTLETLDLRNTKVTDLTPLRELAVPNLNLDHTPIVDLSPFKGKLGFVRLSLFGCENLHDLRPLAECSSLQYLVLPPHCEDIECLRRLPKLQHISYQGPATIGGWDRMPTTAEFWKEYDARKK